MSAADLIGLFGHCLMLSVLAVGGAITTAPDMHRYLVIEHGWLNDAQFTTSVALAQAAPGPNLLFIAVLGWNVGGLPGALATMVGILLPSTLLTLAVTRWGQTRRDTRAARAFTQGIAPLTLGLLVATSWLLSEPLRTQPAAWALIAVTVLVLLRTRASPLWLVGLGAVVGALGYV